MESNDYVLLCEVLDTLERGMLCSVLEKHGLVLDKIFKGRKRYRILKKNQQKQVEKILKEYKQHPTYTNKTSYVDRCYIKIKGIKW